MTSMTTPARATALPQTSPTVGAQTLVDQLDAYICELRALSPDDWARATDCSAWDVRQIAAHIAGSLDEGAHLRTMVRHLRTARRQSPPLPIVDAINAAQVADRQDRTGADIVADIERLAPKAANKRRRTPSLIRRRPVPDDSLPAGSTFSYLFDVIYARDVWMHRIDTARATDRTVAACDSDREVVSQVVRDLARAWTGPAFILELAGAGTGRWLVGDAEPAATVRTDTVEYFRLLSGRTAFPDFEISGDQHIAGRLLAARVTF